MCIDGIYFLLLYTQISHFITRHVLLSFEEANKQNSYRTSIWRKFRLIFEKTLSGYYFVLCVDGDCYKWFTYMSRDGSTCSVQYRPRPKYMQWRPNVCFEAAECPEPYHVRGTPSSQCSSNSFNKWIKKSLVFMSCHEILVLMTRNFRKWPAAIVNKTSSVAIQQTADRTSGLIRGKSRVQISLQVSSLQVGKCRDSISH